MPSPSIEPVPQPDPHTSSQTSSQTSTTSQPSPTGLTFEHTPGPQPDSPTVVFLHAGVADRHMWDAQAAALASVAGTVRPDLRGFGASAVPATGAWNHADDVLEVLDHLALTRVQLVGASFGAGVAAEVALTRPHLVASLVLAPPGGSLLATMTPDLQRFVEAEDAALTRGDLDAASALNVATWLVGPGRDAEVVPEAMRDYVHAAQRRAFEIAPLVGEPVEPEPEAWERTADLTQPLLVLTGQHDLATSHDAADRLLAALPHAQREVWPDAAHLPTLEHPTRASALIGGWLASHL